MIRSNLKLITQCTEFMIKKNLGGFILFQSTSGFFNSLLLFVSFFILNDFYHKKNNYFPSKFCLYLRKFWNIWKVLSVSQSFFNLICSFSLNKQMILQNCINKLTCSLHIRICFTLVKNARGRYHRNTNSKYVNIRIWSDANAFPLI